jgi:uncharacterized protein YjdB
MATKAVRKLETDSNLYIVISPHQPKQHAGDKVQFTATETNQDRVKRDVTGDVFWESSDTTVATITDKGWATALAPGSTTIKVKTDVGVWGETVMTVGPLVSIAVTPPSPAVTVGQTLQFTATGTSSDGTTGDITSLVIWSSSTPGLASIIATGRNAGLATGVAPGSATITATLGAVVSTPATTLTVFPVLVSIAVAPQTVSISAGQQQPFTATGRYSDQSQFDITTQVVWSSSNTSAATIISSPGNNNSGVATGVAAGSTMITATLGGVASQPIAMLTVSPAALVSINITPRNQSIAAGLSSNLTATGNYSDSNTQDLTATAAWASSAIGVATITAPGQVQGIAVGSATITATASGMSGNTVVTVSPAVAKYIVVSSNLSYVGAGQTRQFTAIATYSDGTTQDVTANPATVWAVIPVPPNAPIVATINATGLATGGAAGATTVTATYTDANGTVLNSNAAPLSVLLNFTDLGTADSNTFSDAKSLVQQLLTAFERRGNLSDTEIAQLNDALERITEFLNNNPDTPIPNFNAAVKSGNTVTDLDLLGISWNVDPTKGPIGTGSRKADVIDPRFRAICQYLYNSPPPLPGLEHDPGTFPPGSGQNPGGLTDEQLRVAAVYGYVENSTASPPPYIGVPSKLLTDDQSRRNLFNKTVEEADAHFRTNRALYIPTLARLIQVSQPPQINVSDFSKVVVYLVQQNIAANNPQLNTWIDRGLASAQNVGQDAPPSNIAIDLPDLEQDISNFEIIKDNIFALQPAYFCSMLEELKVFQVVEKLVELFQNGVLPVVKGPAGNLLFAWWKDAALRVSEAERRGFYARSLGFPGGDADSPNREFKDLFIRFVSAVSSFVRQNTVDNLLRSNIPGAISQQQVRKSARDLATNISAHGYGIAYPMATELQKEINDVMGILRNDEVQNAYGAKDVWQLVDQVAALELGGAKNSVKYRTMASAGATVFAWLAQRSQLLASNSYVPVLDITQLQLPPSFSTKPTTNPSDFDLVGACDQWLAVTGTQEDSVEQAAQPVEAPVMPSRPIQIPSVARDMLESVGVQGLAYSQNRGKTNGYAYDNWRTK